MELSLLIIPAIVILVLMTTIPSAFAVTDYQSGFNHGVSDGRVNCPGTQTCHWYILELGKGFAFHSDDFNRGYVAGYCSISGPHTGFDAEEASFDCDRGPTSWNYEIK